MANIHHVKKEVDESLQNVDVQCRQNGAFYVSFLSCFMSGLCPVYVGLCRFISALFPLFGARVFP